MLLALYSWLNMQLAWSISLLLSIASGFVLYTFVHNWSRREKKMQIMSFFQKMIDIWEAGLCGGVYTA